MYHENLGLHLKKRKLLVWQTRKQAQIHHGTKPSYLVIIKKDLVILKCAWHIIDCTIHMKQTKTYISPEISMNWHRCQFICQMSSLQLHKCIYIIVMCTGDINISSTDV